MEDAAALLSLMTDLGIIELQRRTDWQLVLAGLVLLIIWELVWKGLALWRAARIGKPGWFVALLLVHSVGILPILFLIFSRNKTMERHGQVAL